MALVHNVLIHGYNSIHRQAPVVRAPEVVDFLQYSLSWYRVVKAHHGGEEEVYFPGIEKATGVKGIMDSEVEEHGKLSRPGQPYLCTRGHSS